MERLISRNNLIIPLLGTLAGILSATYLHIGWALSISLFIFASGFYLTLHYWSKKPLAAFRLKNFHIVWVFLCFVGIGSLSCLINRPTLISAEDLKEYLYIEGTITDIQYATRGDQITIAPTKIISPNKQYDNISNLKIIISSDHSPFDFNNKIAFRAKLREITDSPNSFQKGYASYLQGKNIFYSANISGDEFVYLGNLYTLTGISRVFRFYFERLIENTKLQTKTKHFLIAILLGDRYYLNPELRESFADAGVAHVLALSGMHTGIIGGIFLFLLFPLNFKGKYKLRILIATFLLWVYAFVSGMSPSTIRACCMITFYSVATVLERKRSNFNALYGAALIILIFSPKAIYDVGFQLSCLCVFSLIAFSNSFNYVERKKHPGLYNFVALILSTIIASLGSWMLSGFHFNYFPVLFLPANIIILPILPIYIAVAIITILMSAFGIELSYVENLLDYVYNHMIDFIQILSDLSPEISIPVSCQALIMWLLGVAIFSIYFNIAKKQYLLVGGAISICLSFVFIFCREPDIKDGSFIVHNYYNDISLSVMYRGKETNINVPRYKTTVMSIGKTRILVLDGDDKLNATNNVQDMDYIILANGYKHNPIALIQSVKPKRVIIHPSVTRRRELSLIDSISLLGIPTHSIRQISPFRHIVSTNSVDRSQ